MLVAGGGSREGTSGGGTRRRRVEGCGVVDHEGGIAFSFCLFVIRTVACRERVEGVVGFGRCDEDEREGRIVCGVVTWNREGKLWMNECNNGPYR